MVILGLSGAISHDPSAALYIDGKLVAAIEEERIIRDKHAKGKMPLESTKFVLEQAGIKPKDVDIVAVPMAPISLSSGARWHYAKRYWYAPDRALDALLNGNRRYRRYVKNIRSMLESLGFEWGQFEFEPVEHHLAHASSTYHLSGFKEKTAIMGVDGKGEYATTFFGYGENGKIHKIKEFYDPDSLGGLYGAITEYLGFDMLDGEYKVMGMAPYGDASKYDLSRLIEFDGKDFQINTKLANVIGLRRYKEGKKGFFFTPELVKWLGPRRKGDVADDPYIHYAASIQAIFEEVTLGLMDHYLGDIIKETGKIAFAGGGALNVKLNQKIIARPEVKELFVQPASGDSGTAIGAASYVANMRGQEVEPMRHVYLGPSFTNEQVVEACEQHPDKPKFKTISDVPQNIARVLHEGNPVAWFQGRMEFGPRALGGRSIVGCPNHPGIADRINEQIKFRERWRPFCPSMLSRTAKEMFKVDHPAPFMTFTFEVKDEWKTRVPEVVHEDGTSRAQALEPGLNDRYYALMEEMEKLTGNGVVLNTSLNRRGEPVVCTPTDALNMFFGSDLQYLIMEDVLVVKEDFPEFV
ncbi:carbamoyltransferase family protein [Parendozoicomonas haliclonae]|uniref:Decarbamoylnovobiocin carbamoyltransferase n=1 Tax=Parendozoicomonas haliclonae TaxID=1960125 RepID=A0A1X7AIZ2_9GAMM|nr:carbamoyltransferase [Parendozoicomonas haliclonae]SMA45784.1 Decarbamoylnovobiocin carbamoyltransferase [Parendozoicomonas haliclonae]